MGPVLGVKRQSLEVPGAAGDVVYGDATNMVDSPPGKSDVNEHMVEKRNSLGRSSARFVGGRRVPIAAAVEPMTQPHGVTLVDRPMDD